MLKYCICLPHISIHLPYIQLIYIVTYLTYAQIGILLNHPNLNTCSYGNNHGDLRNPRKDGINLPALKHTITSWVNVAIFKKTQIQYFIVSKKHGIYRFGFIQHNFPAAYPLVNIQKKTMGNHHFVHFEWANQLGMAIFNSKLLVYRRVK